MKAKVSLLALQFKDFVPPDGKTFEIDVPCGSRVCDVVNLLSERLSTNIGEFLMSKKVVLLFRNRALQYEKDADLEITDGENFIFITPLIGG
ncbi:MAG: hypothetical protein N2513_07375 [Deltaproteobacteria bacterium]|nr:hypothetical protein [Deltaproteobacteria bacterium]